MNILLEATILLPYAMGVIFLSTSIYVATIKPKDKKHRLMKNRNYASFYFKSSYKSQSISHRLNLRLTVITNTLYFKMVCGRFKAIPS